MAFSFMTNVLGGLLITPAVFVSGLLHTQDNGKLAQTQLLSAEQG